MPGTGWTDFVLYLKYLFWKWNRQLGKLVLSNWNDDPLQLKQDEFRKKESETREDNLRHRVCLHALIANNFLRTPVVRRPWCPFDSAINSANTHLFHGSPGFTVSAAPSPTHPWLPGNSWVLALPCFHSAPSLTATIGSVSSPSQAVVSPRAGFVPYVSLVSLTPTKR